MVVCSNDNVMNLYYTQQNYVKSNSVVASAQPYTQPKEDRGFTKKQKMIMGTCSALGVAGALMLLSKFDKSRKYSINPMKILKSNWRNWYLMNGKYESAQVITMGVGSILGGLAGGAICDKKENFNAKVREGLVQITNISLPILSVEGLCSVGKYISNKTMPNWDKSASMLRKIASKLPQTAGAMVGLGVGMYLANKASNKFNEKIFHKKDNRPIELTDFSAHIDDIGVAATFIDDKNLLTKTIARLIPVALTVPGYETACKREAE